MSSLAARNLSVLELLQVLNEKLDLEFARVQEICFLPLVPAAPLQTEVSPQMICLRERDLTARFSDQRPGSWGT